MPNLEEHCKHSLKRYEVEGRDIHSWLDEPSRHYAGIHREFRHDEKTIILVGKTFGEIYGEDKAQAIALDHIMADHEESLKKRSEKNGPILSEIKAYEVEKPKYEKKKEELKKMLKRESELPEITGRGMRDYLDRVYAHSKPSSKELAEISLRHWQHYILSRENPNSDIEIRDITRFVSNLSRKELPKTVVNYLGQIVSYFEHENEKELANQMKSEKLKFDKELAIAKKNVEPMRVKDVIRLYQSTSLRDKVLKKDKILIRLLLLEKHIPVRSLGKIFVRQDSKGSYDFHNEGKIISINEETVKIAKPLIERNISKGDNRLVCMCSRRISERIHDSAEKLSFSDKVNPMVLRKFGKVHRQDELIEWLHE
jgi:hypothetical protein